MSDFRKEYSRARDAGLFLGPVHDRSVKSKRDRCRRSGGSFWRIGIYPLFVCDNIDLTVIALKHIWAFMYMTYIKEMIAWPTGSNRKEPRVYGYV